MNDLRAKAEPDPSASLDEITGERLLSRCPLIVRRRVQWGDCDPAGVVYTPRFADYLAAAYAWFQRSVLSSDGKASDPNRVATPMKALSLEFHHVLRPDELFDMIVHVEDVRNRTFDLRIIGQSPAGDRRFVGRLSPIVVDETFQSIDIPVRLRDALLAYQSASSRA